MQSISGSFAPYGTNVSAGISQLGNTSAPSSTSTLNTVNNITTALMGEANPAPDATSVSKLVNVTLSGALGGSISSLIKSADNKCDMSSEEWAQEVVLYQESNEHLTQEFAQRISQNEGKIGHSGLNVPGFDSPELKNFFEE